MSERRLPRAVAFFGGGSGGHLYPGLALAECARAHDPSFRAVFFRSGRRVEDTVFQGAAFETRPLPIAAPIGPRGWVRYASDLRGAVACVRSLLREGFDTVIGLGGYASVPGIIAARREGVPILLLEQNRVPGRVNRLLSRWASAVSCPDDDTARRLRGRGAPTGNPVRPSVIVAREERRSRRRDPSLRRIVVVGGSQGARGLNEAIRRALPSLVAYRDRIEWLHVAGEADREAIASAYLEHGFSARVESFVPDLPRSFATADLAISRAGGTTLAELTAVGLPAVLVPYPHHRDRHQFKNAEALEEAGAAVVVPEERLDGARLRALFDDVLFDEERLESMERESRRIGRPDAAERVLELLTELRGRCP